ncbi:ParB/RepB/Spo0J family partition protein [Clostridium beijerinckii]|uniref:ParB family chromosome partitioning protein n=1 Tax=Clostridium beijerinckii TaxID=1520 RepID=A0AAE5LRW3_CLOBE|nr:ParB N-terminal domain-containing protein [Clostridium beijerinckii]NOW85340.1 ParB family chromosome partitioning protein [Clostridium beijerinckii]NSB16486.1 ParB family chromosome partitioning protein [Clostridium beijerinckii]OOM25691.1 nucleoid occlusion protein [Clostridium beijerinckii]
MSSFNMLELLNNGSEENENKKTEKIARFKTIQININELIPSEENFYSVNEEELKNLKDSIEIFGVQQNLVVKKLDSGMYEIIAGHRRYLALKKLVEEGKQQFAHAPCKVENEEDSIKDRLLLLITNSTARQLTDWEKTQQAEKLKELLTEYKKKEKLPGRVREIIADILNTSPTQVARMESISKNLTEEFKQEFKEDKVNISSAYEISKLDQDQQEDIFREYQDKGNISIQDVKKRTETEEPSQVTSETGENLEIINNEIVNKDTGEIVQQVVPNYLGQTVLEKIKDKVKEITIDEMANIICEKCTGIGGGNGCSGLCNLALLCKYTNRHDTCVKWLNTKI